MEFTTGLMSLDTALNEMERLMRCFLALPH